MKNIQLFNRFGKTRALDVGAHGGVSSHWRSFLDCLIVDAFEPNREEWERLKTLGDKSIEWHNVALAGKTEERNFHVLKRPTGSSLYPVNTDVMRYYSFPDYYDLDKTISLQCSSLGDFLQGKPAVKLLKLDTQGSELEIIGSMNSEQWASTLALELEVEFQELYKDQPLFEEINSFVKSKGFRLLDLRTHRAYRTHQGLPNYFMRTRLGFAGGSYRHSAEIVAGDALYIRDTHDLSTLSKEDALSYLLILVIYRYYDLALWLLEQPGAATILEDDIRASLIKTICDLAPKPSLGEGLGFFSKVFRKAMAALGRDEKEFFWVSRQAPDT